MKFRYLLLAGAMAQTGVALGMGLGELDVHSYLGNPLQAEIQLVAPAPYDQQDIRIRIARPEIYERFGVRYEPFHNQIDFSVARRGQQMQVQASSQQRVKEPFLDIVVELSWPQGTSYRRYSLLLDPPAYAARRQQTLARSGAAPVEAAAMTIAQTTSTRQTATRKEVSRQENARPATTRAQAIKPRQPATPVARAPAWSAPLDRSRPYVVRSGDSLWKLARRLQGQSQSTLPDLMDQLYAANPDAFINGDRDRLKQGATLHLPASEQTAPEQAVAAAPTLDIQAELATARQQSAALEQATAVPETVAELRAAIAQLQRERSELQQFQAQVKDDMATVLERRVEVTQALLGAESEVRQPAAASASLADAAPVNTDASTAAATTAPATTEPAQEAPTAGVTAQDVATLQALAAPEPATAPATAAEATVTGSAVTLKNLLGQRSSSEVEVSAPALVAPDLSASTSPVSSLLVAQSGSGVWYLLALLPLGLLVGMMGLRSRRVRQIRSSEAVKDEDLYEMVFGARRDRARTDSPDQVRKALEQIREKAGSNDAATAAGGKAGPDYSASRDDLKQMIDLYLLYSQYQKALNVILTEISKRPARTDLRLYLMQVYAKMGDWKSFDEQMDVLQRLGDANLLEEAARLRKTAPAAKN